MSSDIAIRVTNLSKCYEIYDNPRDRLKQFIMPRLRRLFGKIPRQYFREFWALKDVSFEVKKGQTIGIITRFSIPVCVTIDVSPAMAVAGVTARVLGSAN